MDLGESSTSFWIQLPRVLLSATFSGVSPFPSSHLLSSPSLLSARVIPPHLSLPSTCLLASIPRIVLPGISEVLSRIQGLPSSLMDGSAILFHSRIPLRTYTSRCLSSSTPLHQYLFVHSMVQITSRLNSREVRAMFSMFVRVRYILMNDRIL